MNNAFSYTQISDKGHFCINLGKGAPSKSSIDHSLLTAIYNQKGQLIFDKDKGHPLATAAIKSLYKMEFGEFQKLIKALIINLESNRDMSANPVPIL